MKNFFLSFLAFISVITTSCEEDQIAEAKCRNNPKELNWIAALIAIDQNPTSNTAGLEIIQYNYEEKPAFSVNDCVNNCSDALTIIYDCEKKEICRDGGIVGVNTCEDFFKTAKKVAVIYSSRIDIQPTPKPSNCDKSIIVDPELYKNSKATTVIKVEIKGNCLFVTFPILVTQDRIEDVELIDAGVVLESFPIQRNIKLVVKENFTKPALIEETTSFDLSALAEIGEEIIFNLEGFEKSIRYKRVPQCGDPNVKCACGNGTQEGEVKCLKDQFEEIVKLSESIKCEDPKDWKIAAYGSKACGGPQGFIAYSIKIDEEVFLKRIKAYTDAEKAFNIKWGIASDCALEIQPTTIECKDGKPIFK